MTAFVVVRLESTKLMLTINEQLGLALYSYIARDKKVEWHSKLYDKKVGMIAKGLKLNRSPHPESKLSLRCKYGIITSQLHRYNSVCTRRKHFMEPAPSLRATYIKKGFKVGIVDMYFEKFIRNETTCSQTTVCQDAIDSLSPCSCLNTSDGDAP